jgi:Ca-activated chloride channel family protein
VELSTIAEETAPKNDLMATIGQFSGTGVAGRGESARQAMVRQMGGNSAEEDRLRAERRAAEGTGPGQGGDKFSHLEENSFLAVKDAPLSTFSIDVDTASYSKARSFLLEHHRLPPKDAVRIEELINYFDYAYEGPKDDHPFAVHLETAECPWQPKHRLVRCGLQGKKLNGKRPVSNLVFLIDVSGSMNQYNKLPLVQRSMNMLVRQLGENDRVSMVVYAGAAGLVLPPTSGIEQAKILAAIAILQAGGSTNGGEGIQLAYKLAQENFITGGTNRVILCSDGDFNVGVTSTGELIRLAKEKADLGIYLSVLGFGIGNHNDAMLEELAGKANGNYAFIDTDAEAKKVFVEQMEGTLVTIAKDVKIQVEFNPAQVAAYRLVGYENRRLANRDFNDDKKDAGDIGAGHRVTALYEIIPAGVESEFTQPPVDPLKYQAPAASTQGTGEAPKKPAELTEAARSGELLTLKLRYQPPTGGKSTLMTFPVKDSDQRFTAATPDFQFAAAVASFGMLLRDSKFRGNTSYAAVIETATAAKGKDEHGLRQEFLQMVSQAQALTAPHVNPAAPPAATGAWIRPQSPVVSQASRQVMSQLPPAPVRRAQPLLNFSSVYSIFFVGVGLGLIVATIGVLFLLGLIQLRTIFLVNPLPPARKGCKAMA